MCLQSPASGACVVGEITYRYTHNNEGQGGYQGPRPTMAFLSSEEAMGVVCLPMTLHSAPQHAYCSGGH